MKYGIASSLWLSSQSKQLVCKWSDIKTRLLTLQWASKGVDRTRQTQTTVSSTDDTDVSDGKRIWEVTPISAIESVSKY